MQKKLQCEAASVEKLDEIWTKKSWRCLKYGNRGRSNRQILYFQCIVKYKSLNPIAHPMYFIYLLTLLLIHLHFMLFIYSFPPSPAAGLVSVHQGSSSMATWCAQHIDPQCSLVFSTPRLSLPLVLHSALVFPCMLVVQPCSFCPSPLVMLPLDLFAITEKIRACRDHFPTLMESPCWCSHLGAERKRLSFLSTLLAALNPIPLHFLTLPLWMVSSFNSSPLAHPCCCLPATTHPL